MKRKRMYRSRDVGSGDRTGAEYERMRTHDAALILASRVTIGWEETLLHDIVLNLHTVADEVGRGIGPAQARYQALARIVDLVLTAMWELNAQKVQVQDYAAAGLTRRERELMELLASGWSVDAMAERLVLSLHTVRTHLRNARRKLRAARDDAVTDEVEKLLKKSHINT